MERGKYIDEKAFTRGENKYTIKKRSLSICKWGPPVINSNPITNEPHRDSSMFVTVKLTHANS